MILKIQVKPVKVGQVGFRCHSCGHLLFIIKKAIGLDIEIKCNKCKEINTLIVD